MGRLVAAVGFGLMALMAIMVALVSARYLMPKPAFPAPLMILHLQNWPWMVMIHVAGGVTALMLGIFQLVTREGPRRRWHRFAGRVYVLACLSSAIAGFWLALNTTAGSIAAAGFGSLAVAWFGSTVMGWRRAVSGEVAQHRRWMIRSLSLTYAAITLRILILMSPLTGLEFNDAYCAISFLCWVPNLMVAELWLRFEPSGSGRSIPSPHT